MLQYKKQIFKQKPADFPVQETDFQTETGSFPGTKGDFL